MVNRLAKVIAMVACPLVVLLDPTMTATGEEDEMEDETQEEYDECAGTIDPINAENAELWRLVEDMMDFFEDGNYCDRCQMQEACDSQQYDDDCLMRDEFRSRMRGTGRRADQRTSEG